jgi:L-fuculose-phosphate aldolase
MPSGGTVVSVSEMETAVWELIDFGKAVTENGLLTSTAGNVSVRLGDDRMVVSARGSELGNLTPDDVTVVALADATVLEGPAPSLEAELHRAVYDARPGAGSILHCQSRHATLLACLEEPPADLNYIPEVPAYVRAHVYVPYATPGSEALAGSVARAFEDPEVTVAQLCNHGQVIVGASWRNTVRRGVFFELACWMATRGLSLNTIPADAVELLRDYARDV